MANMVELKVTGIDGVLDLLKKLPPEVVSKRGGVVRASLRKGAMVIVKQARINFRNAVNQPGLSGITDTSGFTEKQIIAKRGKVSSGIKGERQLVTVKYVLHPRGGKFRRRPLRANDIAFLMEHGSSKQPATPWLRPAAAMKAQEAVNVTTTELVKRLNAIVKKLARK